MFQGEGGNLTVLSQSEADPLADASELYQKRHMEFVRRFPSFDTIFHSIANGNDAMFSEGLKLFLDLTELI